MLGCFKGWRTLNERMTNCSDAEDLRSRQVFEGAASTFYRHSTVRLVVRLNLRDRFAATDDFKMVHGFIHVLTIADVPSMTTAFYVRAALLDRRLIMALVNKTHVIIPLLFESVTVDPLALAIDVEEFLVFLSISHVRVSNGHDWTLLLLKFLVLTTVDVFRARRLVIEMTVW